MLPFCSWQAHVAGWFVERWGLHCPCRFCRTGLWFHQVRTDTTGLFFVGGLLQSWKWGPCLCASPQFCFALTGNLPSIMNSLFWVRSYCWLHRCLCPWLRFLWRVGCGRWLVDLDWLWYLKQIPPEPPYSRIWPSLVLLMCSSWKQVYTGSSGKHFNWSGKYFWHILKDNILIITNCIVW